MADMEKKNKEMSANNLFGICRFRYQLFMLKVYMATFGNSEAGRRYKVFSGIFDTLAYLEQEIYGRDSYISY